MTDQVPAIEQVGPLPVPLEPRAQSPKVVLVVPAHDEEEVLELAFTEIGNVLDGLGVEWSIVFGKWAANGFGTLREERLAILAFTVIAVGAQVFFTSFLLSIIGLRRPRDEQ